MWLQNWSVTELFWDPFMLSKHAPKIGVHIFVAWPLGQCVTWLCGWGLLIFSHYHAKLGVHRSCESEDIAFFICHVTTILKCHVTLWVGSLDLGVHRPYGTGNNGACNISSNSNNIPNSNSNPEVPIPRFTNGHEVATSTFCSFRFN